MSPPQPRTHADRRAEDFLELVERRKRGRLKVYLGYAAGVGKTYRMLEEAHALLHRGVDVVIGYVETHGRQETGARLAGLPEVPRRTFQYRGVTLEELDVDAVLLRRPEVVIIDEVAHTNVPGSRNRRRYQDVLEVLGAGIHVLCALNIQHLESLNDVVSRATGVQVRETVPDSFLQQADQIVTLDLDVEDLLDRLRAGKIYAADKIDWALAHFFQPGNLTTLRELALREVAESLGRQTSPPQGVRMPLRAGGSAQPTSDAWGGKLMVCLSSNPPHGRMLLRRGSRLAGRLNTAWYVVYVETPVEAPMSIDATAQRKLMSNIELARELGAEVVRLRGSDPVATLVDFARAHAVSDIVIGRSPASLLNRLLGRSFSARMVERAVDCDLHIVCFPAPRRSDAAAEAE